MLTVTPTAHWLEVLDLARAILAEPIEIVDGTITARGLGLGLSWDEAAVAKISGVSGLRQTMDASRASQ
jgi:mandelate racemase